MGVPKVTVTFAEQVKKQLESAQRVVAFTGAGISEESGLATFRGEGGLWNGHRVEDVATPQAFKRDPKFVWDFYLERRKNVANAKPNAAHEVIAQWEKKFLFAGVVTQNIDGLHAAAGSTRIQELHGSIWKARCLDCSNVQRDQAATYEAIKSCERCGGALRPHIVWFGENLETEVMDTALSWMREADLVFVVGASGVVEPAASLVRSAKRFGAFIVEVNMEETALTSAADISVFGKSSEVFSRLSKSF